MRRLFWLTGTGGGVVDGLFDSRDMDPRVRFGGLDEGGCCVLDEEEDVDDDRFSSPFSDCVAEEPPVCE